MSLDDLIMLGACSMLRGVHIDEMSKYGRDEIEHAVKVAKAVWVEVIRQKCQERGY